MSLRINHNIAAINSHRNLVRNDANLTKTLEHLSSGVKINRSSDGPAALVISEQMRAQVAGLKQAVMNSETAVAMVQTAEASLNEVNQLLVGMRQLAVHAANAGVNDNVMLEADQAELVNALDSVDRIAKNTQFGTKPILDGSHGVTGTAVGDSLSFVSSTAKTKSSPQSGYEVKVFQEATQAEHTGTVALSRSLMDAGETITLSEGGKSIQLSTKLGENIAEFQNRLNNAIDDAGLGVDVFFDVQGKLTLLSREYGSDQKFSVTSSTAGVASELASTPMTIQNGLDIRGTIGNEATTGRGQVLTGSKGTNIEGLQVRFTGISDPLKPEVGRIGLESNALTFQIGGNRNQIAQVAIPSTSSSSLATGVNNESGFTSLRELDLRSFNGAQDAMTLIDTAINQVSSIRADMGALQKNTLESNLASLSIAKENLINADSVIRDTDMASEMSQFTKYQIMSQSATAMLAQANQTPNNVLSLLK